MVFVKKGLISDNTDSHRTSILLIGIANSVHTARWVEQFKGQSFDFTLIPSTASRTIHPAIRELSQQNRELTINVPGFFKVFSFPIGICDMIFGRRLMGLLIGTWLLFTRRRFDIVHAMELQHAGYILSSIRPRATFGKRIVSNWGSDIYWFQRFPRHKKRLKKLLEESTHYACECQRDIGLALNLGFSGTTMDVQPNAGPIALKDIEKGETSLFPSQRRIILVKGYTGFVGRADIALKALSLCSEELKGYEILLYSTDRRSRRLARNLSNENGVEIRSFKKYKMNHEQMLQLFRESRVYLGISMSDGISTSLLEAMASGAFPIQSDTSCADEWVINGTNGFIVPWDDPVAISKCIQKALTDDVLVDSAREINTQISLKRLSPERVESSRKTFYST